MRSAYKAGLWALMILLFAAGCANPFARPGERRVISQTVELEGAEQVDVDIRAGIQDLRLQGGAAALFEGEFTYNLDALEPRVDYSVDNGTGKLEVALRRESINMLPVGNVVSDWDLRLNQDVPLAFNLASGLGDSRLDLRDLTLTDLDLQAGAGSVDVQVGQQNMERLRVRAGLGNVNLDVNGGRIEELDFEAGAGNIQIDLSGDWQSDLDAEIRGGLGNIDLTVPDNVGVRVEVDRGLGDIDASGFRLEDNAYLNDAYGESEVTLEIQISQGAGNVDLRIAR